MGKRLGILVAIAIVAGTVLAGCGSSKPKAPGESGLNLPTATASAGVGTTGSLSSSDCLAFAQAFAAASAAGAPNAGLANVVETLQAAVAAAPESLRADLNTFITGMQKYFNTLRDAGINLATPSTYTSTDKISILQRASADLSKDTSAASTRLQAGLAQLCGTS